MERLHDMKLDELQVLMDSRSHHIHEEEMKQSPFFRAKAAFELSEKYRRKRDKVMAEVGKSVHKFGRHEGKQNEDAMRLRYQIPNHLEGYEVNAGSPSPMEKALAESRAAFEYSEDRRDERTLDEVSLKKKKEERLDLIRHHVTGICVEKKSLLNDEESHHHLCQKKKLEGEEVMYMTLFLHAPDTLSLVLNMGHIYSTRVSIKRQRCSSRKPSMSSKQVMEFMLIRIIIMVLSVFKKRNMPKQRHNSKLFLK